MISVMIRFDEKQHIIDFVNVRSKLNEFHQFCIFAAKSVVRYGLVCTFYIQLIYYYAPPLIGGGINRREH